MTETYRIDGRRGFFQWATPDAVAVGFRFRFLRRQNWWLLVTALIASGEQVHRLV